MSRTVDLLNRSGKNEYSAQVVQEVSDTETIYHDHLDQGTELSDAETIDHTPTDLEEPHAACQDVLATTELLEHIISFLPTRKIFTIQLVLKQ